MYRDLCPLLCDIQSRFPALSTLCSPVHPTSPKPWQPLVFLLLPQLRLSQGVISSHPHSICFSQLCSFIQ